MLKKLSVAALIAIFLVSIPAFATPVAQACTIPTPCPTPQPSTGSVVWTKEDTTTQGNWQNTYGKCAHIFPGAPSGGFQIPEGPMEVPGGDGTSFTDPYLLQGTIYAWDPNQINGYANWYLGHEARASTPPYWDEYVVANPSNPVITYSLDGTREYAGTPIDKWIEYPVFTFAWSGFFTNRADLKYPNYDGWDTTLMDPRPLYYTQNTPDVGGPGWRAAAWDDGGERCQPPYGYMNFTLVFPIKGSYVLSLYAYDYEDVSRWSQEYRIYNEAGNQLLASKEIEGTVFDNGVYESFKVTVPDGGMTIILQVYNNAGHVPYVFGETYPADKTNNVVLSGIFVECVTCPTKPPCHKPCPTPSPPCNDDHHDNDYHRTCYTFSGHEGFSSYTINIRQILNFFYGLCRR
jgi:hypothetical protein